MFDFFGIFNINGSVPVPPFDPFNYLIGEENLINFDKLELDWQQMKFIVLCRESQNSPAFEDAKVGVLVFGTCYAKLEATDPNFKGEIGPVELARLYLNRTESFYSRLKGSFIIVIFDKEKKKLNIFTDPLNLHSLYFIFYGGKMVISSSLQAMVTCLSQNGWPTLQLDYRSVLDLYLFDYILDDHTFIDGVRELPAGTLLEVSPEGISHQLLFNSFTYFDTTGPKMGREEGARQLAEVLSTVIDQYDRGSDQTAVALTGGFDSRSILAMMDARAQAYQFFSYGRKGSWDLRIPTLIADQLHLNYSPIYLESSYRNTFEQYAKLVVKLSDGLAEVTHANIAYVYANYLRDKTSILTGLFGSELIKTPSSRGLFIDKNIISLLTAQNLVDSVRKILFQSKESEAKWIFTNHSLEEEMIEMIRSHPYVNNDLPLNEKFFQYLLMVGARKYFRKEIKIQRPWKVNLHPFFDLDFITCLLTTPYPWVYNFSMKKSLVNNLIIHKIYSKIISRNPQLANIISTHGYRPRYLLENWRLPMLLFEYFTYKKTISKSSQLNFQQDYGFELIQKDMDWLFKDTGIGINCFLKLQNENAKNFLKLASLQYWLRSVGLTL